METKKLYYSIGEVASELRESVTLVRYWTNYFPQLLAPKRNARGNRYYTPEQLDILRQLHYLIKECGMTLDGAAARLKSDKKEVSNRTLLRQTLESIRKELEEVRKSL